MTDSHADLLMRLRADCGSTGREAAREIERLVRVGDRALDDLVHARAELERVHGQVHELAKVLAAVDGEDIWKEYADKIAVANGMSSERVMDMLQNFMRSQAHAPMTSLSDIHTCYRCGTPVTCRIHDRA